MDEFQLQTAVDPQISLDGKKIVYVRRFADPMTDKRYSNLWVLNADGTDHRPISSGNHSYTSPRWSPDSTRIAFLSDVDGKPQIYVRWMDTGQTARITNLEQSPDAIAWSPDGRMISFSSLVAGKGPHLADLPQPPPAQNGRTRQPPMIAWCTVSTVRVTSTRISGQGGARRIRRAGAARLSGLYGRGSRYGGEPARRSGLGRQGADPCRRARQGRRRQGGQIDRRRARGSQAAARRRAGHPSDRPHGKQVNRLYIEDGSLIDREFYLSALVDRESSRIAFVVSTEGGMDIEEVARSHPERIMTFAVDPATGVMPHHGRRVAQVLGLSGELAKKAESLVAKLYAAFVAKDMSMLEINPLVVTKANDLVCLDAKIGFDDNALYRHPDIVALRDLTEEDAKEIEASKYDLNYVALDGTIGCMVNGAGLAMATMDIIKLYGEAPANFLDVRAQQNVAAASSSPWPRGEWAAATSRVRRDIEEVGRRLAVELDDVHVAMASPAPLTMQPMVPSSAHS